MLAQVVDAVLGHQHAVAPPARHARAGHLEVLHDGIDRLDGLVGGQVERGGAQVAVEDHVQVLVGGDAGEHAVGDRIVADATGIAVADPGGQFLEGHIRDGEQESGTGRGVDVEARRLVVHDGHRRISVGHVDHSCLLERDRVDPTGHHEVVAQDDPVAVLLGGPAAYPGAPGAVLGEVLGDLTVVGGLSLIHI